MSDEDAAIAEAVATVFVEEEAGNPEVLGGPLRGTILHKLMEEVLTGEVFDDVNSLEIRSAELLAQLGETPAEDPSEGLVPNELAQVVVNTLALPEVSALRDRLRAEFTVFEHYTDAAEPQNEIALSGVTDAVALAPDGKIEVVVDWKSDVSPTNALRERYRTQVRDYLNASGAPRGLIIYITVGQVEEVFGNQFSTEM
jgi:exodeoxyribonuclease-5